MSEKLKDYQVIEAACGDGGDALYAVRHKATNNIFAWRPHDCSALSDEQIQNVHNEVKTLSGVLAGNLLRYYDTILHAPTRTLYLVLEYTCWRSVRELSAQCGSHQHFAERFIWYLLRELARAAKTIQDLQLVALRKCITTESIFVGPNCEIRINCFTLSSDASSSSDLMQQIGKLIHALCYQQLGQFHYSDDLRDVIDFLTDDRNSNLRPDVVLYHPTVLANTDIVTGPKHLSDIFASTESPNLFSETNKCDSEKAVEQCRMIEPLPRTHIKHESPIYCNISPKWKFKEEIEESVSPLQIVSPTVAALALELPGYVPRSRQPYSEALEVYNGPQKLSEDTLSHQWMSRLVALRQREESLNKRERDIIAKEIMNSPSTKVVSLDHSTDSNIRSNGITLPPVLNQLNEVNGWVSRRRHRRSSSVKVKGRRKSYAYEDLDSSLSADNGDSSMIVTAARITKENMPHKLFPDVSSKRVHFTSSNPFVESDDSVTLTFYEVEEIDQVPKVQETEVKDITKFKYLDLEKINSKRTGKQWNQSSPSKQAKVSEKVFSDITNSNLRKTPSKTSITSKGSNFSRSSVRSSKSVWSFGTANGSEGSFDKEMYTQTPSAPPELKKSKRKSLLPFKTPFKFKTSTKV